MNIATWNIGSLFSDFDKNILILQQILTQYQPQLLVLEEYVPVEALDAVIAVSTNLKRIYYLEYSDSHIAIGHSMGVAVFGTGHVDNIQVHKLLKPNKVFFFNGKAERFHDKYFFKAEWHSGGKIMRFVTGHGFSFHRYSIDPTYYRFLFDDLEQWLKTVVTPNTLVLGDFNLQRPSEVLPWLCSALNDVYIDCATRPSGIKSDCIFLPKSADYRNVVNCQCYDYVTSSGLDHNYLQVTVAPEIFYFCC